MQGVESLVVVEIGFPSLEAKEPKLGICVCIGKERAGSRWAESDAAGKATNPGLVFLNCVWVGSGGGD